MSWDDLFADLQAQFLAHQRAEQGEVVADLVEAEAATTTFGDRMRAATGRSVTVRLLDGSDRRGVVTDAAPTWFVLAEGERRSLVRLDAVVAAWPLAGVAPAPGRVEQGLRLGHVLRALAADGVPVVVHTLGGMHRGRIVRVGADHLDLATGTAALVLPWTALLSVDSQ
ncbi:hypothetical protein EXU48_07575 [Occultella glacieicola]|uniref:Uncharacterized protein n=1 Tax=Occultella glacieicola TaxID=2518684 RepID=A0ABY2E7E9_9MICO|nr:hypothetical protein [Occultella glacieicola]TDE96087.1 hypothetical protein EXU48_07575 [Occultella glacieicola]